MEWPAAWSFKDKLFATQALSQTEKNVSEPQMGIKPATFWSPVKSSNKVARLFDELTWTQGEHIS